MRLYSIAFGSIFALLLLIELMVFRGRLFAALPVAENDLERIAVDTVTDPQVTGYPDSRKLVRNSRGDLFLAYRKKLEDGTFHPFVARLPYGADRFDNTKLSIESTPISHTQRVPSIAIDDDDRLHVVWYGADESSAGVNERQIHYTHAKADSKGTLDWAPVTSPAGRIPGYLSISPPPTLWQEHPVIFAAPQGRIYIAWEGKDQDNTQQAQIKLIRSSDGGESWKPWQNIPGEPGVYYSRPTIVSTIDGATLYVLAYATSQEGVAQIVWTHSLDQDADPGDRWAPWRYVSDLDGNGRSESIQDQRHLSAVVDSRDQLHLVWRQKPEEAATTDKTQIHVATYRPDRGWSTPGLLLANPQRHQSFPTLTIDKDQRLWAAWNESEFLPDFPNEQPVASEIRAAKRPAGSQWRAIATPVISTGQRALYPSLRWQRYGSKYGVDLTWAENALDDPGNTSCLEGKTETCTIYYANLAGQ
jgi:hypothetical protein